MIYPENYLWRPASGMMSKGRTLWRLWKEANPAGQKEYLTPAGRVWYCWSYEAARRNADTINKMESATAFLNASIDFIRRDRSYGT